MTAARLLEIVALHREAQRAQLKEARINDGMDCIRQLVEWTRAALQDNSNRREGERQPLKFREQVLVSFNEELDTTMRIIADLERSDKISERERIFLEGYAEGVIRGAMWYLTIASA